MATEEEIRAIVDEVVKKTPKITDKPSPSRKGKKKKNPSGPLDDWQPSTEWEGVDLEMNPKQGYPEAAPGYSRYDPEAVEGKRQFDWFAGGERPIDEVAPTALEMTEGHQQESKPWDPNAGRDPIELQQRPVLGPYTGPKTMSLTNTQTTSANMSPEDADAVAAQGDKAIKLQELAASQQTQADRAHYDDIDKAASFKRTDDAINKFAYEEEDAKLKKEAATVEKEVQLEAEKVRDWRVDQGRAFRNPVRKGMMVLAAALESLGHGFYRMGGVNPGPKTVINMMDNIIERDVQAQLVGLQNMKEGVSQKRLKLGDIRQRKGEALGKYRMLKADRLLEYQENIKVIQNTSKNRASQAYLNNVHGKLGEKRAMLLRQEALDRTEKKVTSTRQGTHPAFKAHLAALAQQAQTPEGKPLKDKILLEVRDMKDTYKRMDSFKKKFMEVSKGKSITWKAFMNSAAGKALGSKYQAMRAAMKSKAAALRKTNETGVMTDLDFLRYLELLPTTLTADNIAEFQFNSVLDDLESKYTETMRTFGRAQYDVKSHGEVYQ